MFWICLIHYIAQGHSKSYWVLIERWTYSGRIQGPTMEYFGKKILVFNYFSKKFHVQSFPCQFHSILCSERVLNMCRVLNMSEFWIFTNFRKYYRVLNMRWDAIMEGFWDFKYARFLHMQALYKIPNMPEYDWTMPCGKVFNVRGQRFTGF